MYIYINVCARMSVCMCVRMRVRAYVICDTQRTQMLKIWKK